MLALINLCASQSRFLHKAYCVIGKPQNDRALFSIVILSEANGSLNKNVKLNLKQGYYKHLFAILRILVLVLWILIIISVAWITLITWVILSVGAWILVILALIAYRVLIVVLLIILVVHFFSSLKFCYNEIHCTFNITLFNRYNNLV